MKRPDKGPHLDEVVRGGETLKVVRKKALLRTLAMRELEREGLEVPRAEVQEMTDDFRTFVAALGELAGAAIL